MSGDVQPRKRKDKKRKKDEGTEQLFAQPPNIAPATVNEDVNIHIHKEGGTGGGICAKVVFFLLFSALAILIGLIITEHRGLTDLDTVEQESRFSQIFEGWIDSSPSHGDEHDDNLSNDLEDEPIEHELEEDAHNDEEEEESEVSEEETELDDDEQEDEATEEVENEQDEEDEDNEQSVQSDEIEEQNVESEEVENESELRDNDDDEEDEEDDEDTSRFIEKSAEEQNIDDDDEVSDHDDDTTDLLAEEDQNLSRHSDEKQDKDTSQEETDDEEELDKSSENEEKEKLEEVVNPEVDEKSSNINMVVKIGVGLALLVVAHVVLIRKWKSATPASVESTDDQIPSDFTRRNTIVVPPTYQEVQHDIEENAEEYSDEDGEIESDDDDRVPIKSTQVKYQELRTTYQRSLTPESETENKQTDEDEYEEEIEEEDDDEEEEEEEEGSDEDDEELLKRLEAKYGKLQDQTIDTNSQKDSVDEQFSTWKRVKVSDNNEPVESDSDKQSDTEAYAYEHITSKEDSKIKDEIDRAQTTIRDNATYAIKLFDMLLQQFPSSPRCLYGKAQALDLLAEEQRSNEFLQKAIQLYLRVLNAKDVPDALFQVAADRCINRMRFIGSYNQAVDVHFQLMKRFPSTANYKNELVITYLIMNQVAKARKVVEDLLLKHPDDGLALVHYGFILKIVDNRLNESVDYLRRGIASKAKGVVDGRFYFHLGDALSRLGRQEEAMQVYEEGVKYNLFLSKYQRSLYNVRRLKGQPWWEKSETQYKNLYAVLEKNWQQIRDEGLAALNRKSTFQNESENLKDTGDWKQLELFARGQKNVDNCRKCPITCKIIESIPEARTCRRGQTKFSVMHPGTHVWPHCGPTNCRLRTHLGLKVPEFTYIRVAKETRSWKEGKVFIFDDSFEHEVWHNGTTPRLVLIVDVWHPELTLQERRGLSPI